jgi:hypothetical protein
MPISQRELQIDPKNYVKGDWRQNTTAKLLPLAKAIAEPQPHERQDNM